MESRLIEALRAYRTQQAARTGQAGFRARPDYERTLSAILAADRLLAVLVEPMPPAALDRECAIPEAR